MKTILKNTFVFAIILAMFSSCSKYEDGPWISFRSAEKRLTSHVWYVESFKKNDIDLTAEWKNNFNWGFEFNTYYDNLNYGNAPRNIFIISNGLNLGGAWQFKTVNYDAGTYDDTKINIRLWLNSTQDTIGLYPLQTNNRYIEYNILRLKMKEMNLEFSDSLSNVYCINLK